MEQDRLAKALVQSKRMGNLLNEVLDLSQQMAEALDRDDQVAVEMLIAMRQEPIGKLEEVKRALEEQAGGLEPEEALRLSLLLNGAEPEEPEEQALAAQVAVNSRRLKRVLELDRVLNPKVTRGKSIY